jgi:hypothetical protein
MALSVAAIKDDRGVVRDAERPQRHLEFLGRAAVPVPWILEPVRVEIQRPGNVTVLVLFRNPEIDVEDPVLAGRSGFRASPIQQVAEPFGVNELLVVGQAIGRQRLVGRPLGPSARVDADACVAQLRQSPPDGRRVLRPIAVDDDLSAWKYALRVE